MATRKIILSLVKRSDVDLLTASNKVGAIQQFYKSPDLSLEPEIIYMENVITLSDAVRSLNLDRQALGDVFPGMTTFLNRSVNEHIDLCITDLGTYYLFSCFGSGTGTKYYIYKNQTVGWELFYTTDNSTVPRITATTNFQNKTIIFLKESTTVVPPTGYTLSGDSLSTVVTFLHFEELTAKLVVKRATGFTSADSLGIRGVASYSNYMLLWDNNRLYWSSPLEYWAFAPSPGLAGSALISEGQGRITAVVAVANGILVFFTFNIVYGVYTGDANNPFNFSEVIGSGGLVYMEPYPVSNGYYSGLVVAYTTKGLQIIQENIASPLPKKLLEVLQERSNPYKLPSSAEILHSPFRDVRNRLRNIFVYGTKVFISGYYSRTANSNAPAFGVTTIIDLADNTISQINLDIVGICGSATNYSNSSVVAARAGGLLLLVRDAPLPATAPFTYGLRLLTLEDTALIPPTTTGNALLDPTPSVLLIGNISINPDTTTVIESIRLIGKTTASDGTQRATVKVYSVDINGPNSPVEFVYYAPTDTYYGIVEGRKLQIEIEGYYFYLQSIEVEVAAGGLR